MQIEACTDHSHPHPHVQPQQNIYQTQQQLQGPPHAHYKQYNPNASYTDNLPPPPIITTATSHPPQTISGNPNYTQQQQIYIQQQQMYAQQQYQTLRRKQAQAQAQAQQMGHISQQPIYQPQQQNPPQQVQQQAQQQMALPPQPIAQVSMQQQQQQHQPHPTPQVQFVVTSGNYTPAPPSATMAVVTANNAIYVQSSTNPTQNTTTLDNSMYDRDKQIYKCSTLGRHVGKYNEQRQNLVPAVIPTVPQIPKFNGQPQMTAATTTPNNQMTSINSSTLRPSIQNCPLPDIPNIQTSTFKSNTDMIGNDLPQNRFELLTSLRVNKSFIKIILFQILHSKKTNRKGGSIAKN